MAAFGSHLMLDCSGCSGIDNKENISNFVKELVPAIGMIAHGEPIIEYMLPGEPNQGYSLVQLITTSNITAHFLDLEGTAYIDVFSCKNFDIDIPEVIVKKYFNPSDIKFTYLTRSV